MSSTLRSDIVRLGDLRFQVLNGGPRDGEPVLLLHGFPQFADIWIDTMSALMEAGYRVAAPDQRGYSAGARPAEVAEYAVDRLVGDALAIADALRMTRFHLVGHDWGGFLAWKIAAAHPERVRSLTVLSMPHGDAFVQARTEDADQQKRSQYIQLFRMPGNVAESYLLANGGAKLREVYQGKVADAVVESNVRRFSEPGALTAALNWYRAADLGKPVGKVRVPTLYVWGSGDMALGPAAARGTRDFVEGDYRFEVLDGLSHWLVDEAPAQISELLLGHLAAIGRA